MQSKKFKFALLILGQGLILGQANATISSKTVQIYAGLAGGLANMTNKESQSVSFPNGAAAGTPTYIPFQNNVSQSSRNGLYSAFGGITWNIPTIHMFIGPEIYIGRSNNEIQKSVTVPEDVTFTNRSMQTTVRSSNYAGGTIQIGANLPMKFKPFVLIGVDLSQFQHSIFYVPRSTVALGHAGPDLNPATFSQKKWLRGMIWGFGLEKEFSCYRIGADVRFVQYRKTTLSNSTDSGDAVHALETINSTFRPKVARISVRFSYLF